MEANEINSYLNNETVVYSANFQGMTHYILIFNCNENYSKSFINCLIESGDSLKMVPAGESEAIFKCPQIANSIESEIDKEKNFPMIKEICFDKLINDKKVFILYEKSELYFYFNNEWVKQKLETSDDFAVVAVILNEGEKVLKRLRSNNGSFEVTKVAEEVRGSVADIFETQDAAEEEDLDKEFQDYEEEEIEQSRDKGKQHMKRKKKENMDEEQDIYAMTSRKRGRADPDPIVVQQQVSSFIAKLREAAYLDKESLKKRRPALEKMKLLQKIEQFLANLHYQRAFLDQSGLEVLQDWLKKNQDGSYPPLNQLSEMLSILSGIPVSLAELKECKIGGYVNDISKNLKESRTVQKKARDLVDKWSRIVFDINTSYMDYDLENRKYKEAYKRASRRATENESDEGNEDNEEENFQAKVEAKREEDIYSKARIPKKGLFDFTVKPVSNISESLRDENAKPKYHFIDKKEKRKKR